jgi:hypothetical protein
MGSYSGTSFKILFSADGIISNHPIFFKQCAEGQNGCTSSSVFNLRAYHSALDGITPSSQVFVDSNYYWLDNPLQQLVGDVDQQKEYAAHITIDQGTLWKDPNSLTWTITFEGLVQKLVGNSYNILDMGSYPAIVEPTNPPLVDFIDESQTDVTDWAITPIGHWRIRGAIGQDYWQADPAWPGSGFPTDIPALYKIEFFDGADSVATIWFSMGYAA